MKKQKPPKTTMDFIAFVDEFRRQFRGLRESSKIALNAYDMAASGKLKVLPWEEGTVIVPKPKRKQVRVVPKHNLYKKGK
jgi:hypothetical protein